MPYLPVIRAYTTQIAKQRNELLSSILLLLLFILLIYLDMCTGVRSIPHTSIYE